jgi:hypothetical protein
MNRSVLRLLVTGNVDPSSPIFVTLMLEMICSSEISVFTKAIHCNIRADGILQEIYLYGALEISLF